MELYDNNKQVSIIIPLKLCAKFCLYGGAVAAIINNM